MMTKVEWDTIADRRCLFVTFDGKLTRDEAVEASRRMRDACDIDVYAGIVMVWDCVAMTGYEGEARVVWQDAIRELKPRIEAIWLISTSPFIRIGANVIGVFTGLEIHACASREEIKL